MFQPGRFSTFLLIATMGATLILVLASQTGMAWGGNNIIYSGDPESPPSITTSVNSTMAAIEVAYSYGPSGEKVLGSGNITPFNGSDIVNFTVDAGSGGSPSNGKPRRMDSIQKEIIQKINRGNEPVSNEGRRLVGNIRVPAESIRSARFMIP